MKRDLYCNVDKQVLAGTKKGPVFYRLKAAVCVLMGWHTKMAIHDGVMVAVDFNLTLTNYYGRFVAAIRVPRGLRNWQYESYWAPTVRR